MIEVQVNGEQRVIAPGTLEELRSAVLGPIPSDHGICLLRVNGRELLAEHWSGLHLAEIRKVEVRSAPRPELARAAVRETHEWISRICAALEETSRDYRLGREERAGSRMAEVADALHVLAHLMSGIFTHIALGDVERQRLESEWHAAESELSSSIEAMANDLAGRDPIALADRTGYGLPRTLRTFQRLLEELRT